MIDITQRTTLKELASMVGKILNDAGIDAVLTGGAVVSIYTDNKYQSFDLDFVTHSSLKELEQAFEGTGFYREGRSFKHPNTNLYVDFPAPPLAIGDNPVTEFNEIKSKNRYLKLLTPTDSVMDRLAAYYHWDDQQSLNQALMISVSHEVNFKKIKNWSVKEGMKEKFESFFNEHKKREKSKNSK